MDSSFPFYKLPPEIRLMIWGYALPDARVYEVLDAPNAKQKTPPQTGLMFANIRYEPPPALASVCRESRCFVLRHYKPLTLSSTTKYVDLSRDILLLEPYLLVKRLFRTLHFLSQIPLVRDNAARLALGTSYGLHTGICHPVLSWRMSKSTMKKLLARLSKFAKLKKLLFVVHQEFQFEFDLRYTYPYGAANVMLHSPNGSKAHNSSKDYGSGTYDFPSVSLAPSEISSSPPSSLSPTPPPAIPHSYQQPVQPRPQLVHQAYRFKFDIESNINYTYPRRPHHNEFLMYPLAIDEDREDYLDSLKEGLEEEGMWCDPWPTNDDWRRFRRRFAKALFGAWQEEKSRGVPVGSLPGLEGASLLWRYTR
ncbi:hypothetical protein VUR80DRAFT_821 [Thermomyces stellatus]